MRAKAVIARRNPEQKASKSGSGHDIAQTGRQAEQHLDKSGQIRCR